MTSILFIWVLSAGRMQLAASETFYSMEACQSAARAGKKGERGIMKVGLVGDVV